MWRYLDSRASNGDVVPVSTSVESIVPPIHKPPVAIDPVTQNALLIFTLKGNQQDSDLHSPRRHAYRGEAQQACTGSEDQAGTSCTVRDSSETESCRRALLPSRCQEINFARRLTCLLCVGEGQERKKDGPKPKTKQALLI